MDLSELNEREIYIVHTETVTGKPMIVWHQYYSIYSLINLSNGKRYIGRTTNPRRRIRTHLSGINSKKHINRLINADSDCQFDFEILADHILDINEAKRLERMYMYRYKTYDEKFGYNCNDRMMRKIRMKQKEGEA